MFYEAELNFLCNTLEKCHIQTIFLNPNAQLDEQIDLGLRGMLQMEDAKEKTFYSIVNPIEEATIYRLVDGFSGTHFFCCCLIKV